MMQDKDIAAASPSSTYRVYVLQDCCGSNSSIAFKLADTLTLPKPDILYRQLIVFHTHCVTIFGK